MILNDFPFSSARDLFFGAKSETKSIVAFLAGGKIFLLFCPALKIESKGFLRHCIYGNFNNSRMLIDNRVDLDSNSFKVFRLKPSLICLQIPFYYLPLNFILIQISATHPTCLFFTSFPIFPFLRLRAQNNFSWHAKFSIQCVKSWRWC